MSRIGATLVPLAAALVIAAPIPASAQSNDGAGTLYYGISAGLGHRAVSGSLSASALPAGAGQPPSRATAAIGLEAGLGVARRVGVFVIFDNVAALSDANGWGSLDGAAVLRAWVGDHLWVEGGVDLTELAFQLPAAPAVSATLPTSRFWHAGFETGAGYELFHGPTVTLHVFVRYTQATFDALRQRTLSVQVGLLGRH